MVSSSRIEEKKQYMRDNTLVGKFLGLWPFERDLVKWIQYWWKPKGHYDLQLGLKGFFTIIFHNLEDRNRIFDGGPYFYNSTGLFLRFWTEKFSPERKTSPMHQCGSDCTHSPRNFGWKRSSQESTTPSASTSIPPKPLSSGATCHMHESVYI